MFVKIYFTLFSLLALFSLFYFIMNRKGEKLFFSFFGEQSDLVDWRQRRTEVEKYCEALRSNSNEQLSMVIFK